MKRNGITLILCIVSSIFMLIYDFSKFDIITKVKGGYSFGAGIVTGYLLWIPYILYGILAIWTVCYIFRKIKEKWWRSFIPAGVTLITILLLFVFPYTKLYLNLNYSLNKECLQKTVQLMNNGGMQKYQIGSEEYVAPYRSTSYSGILYTDAHDEVTKIMFYAFDGLKRDVVIVYSSDDSSINERDFSGVLGVATWNISNINKMHDNWYSATISGYKMGSDFYPVAVPS